MQKPSAIAGIDWAAERHAVCVLDSDGRMIERFDITHDSQVLRAMVSRLRKNGVATVAIERGDGPVVQVLIDAGLAVFVVPSRQIKALRTRYGSAGNKDDRLDAYVLADTLRTDGHRWRPLREDHPETEGIAGDVPGSLGARRDACAGDEPAPVQPRTCVPWGPRVRPRLDNPANTNKPCFVGRAPGSWTSRTAAASATSGR